MRFALRLYGLLIVAALVAAMSSAVERIDADAQLVADSSYCPDHFRDKAGRARMGDLRYAVATLSRLDLDPLLNINDTYVVGGKVHFMAALQRTLAARAGWDLELDESSDARSATVRIKRMTEATWRPPVTVTMEEARQAKWTDRNAVNYATMPDRMLAARACTKAIDLYAPGALRIIDDATFYDVRVEDAKAAIDGPRHTVQREEPTVDGAVIAELHRRLDDLEASDRDQVRASWKGLAGPNLDGPHFTLRDAALLHRLIGDYENAAAGAPPVATPASPDIAMSSARPEPGEATTDDPTRPFDDE